jgi:hypothetical protein
MTNTPLAYFPVWLGPCFRQAQIHMTTSWRFDRGTLIVHGPLAASWQGVVWDDRTQNYRASAHRYASLRAEALAAGEALDDPLSQRRARTAQPWTPPPQRPYQRDALTTWLGQGKRGVIVLPTGAGKTRIAIGATAALKVPTAILCPTRVLLGQWAAALRDAYGGEIGAVGDGEQRVEERVRHSSGGARARRRVPKPSPFGADAALAGSSEAGRAGR